MLFLCLFTHGVWFENAGTLYYTGFGWNYILFILWANNICVDFVLFFVDFLFKSSYGIWFENAGIKRTRFTTQFLDAITPPSRQYSYIEYILTFKATARISRYHSRLNFKIPSQMPFQNLFWRKHQALAQFNK